MKEQHNLQVKGVFLIVISSILSISNPALLLLCTFWPTILFKPAPSDDLGVGLSVAYTSIFAIFALIIALVLGFVGLFMLLWSKTGVIGKK